MRAPASAATVAIAAAAAATAGTAAANQATRLTAYSSAHGAALGHIFDITEDLHTIVAQHPAGEDRVWRVRQFLLCAIATQGHIRCRIRTRNHMCCPGGVGAGGS